MTIKQNGGVFGRNPTFNDVTIEGQLTFDGDIDINSDLKIDGNLVVDGTATMDGLTVQTAGVNYLKADQSLGSLMFQTNGSNNRMFLAHNGDISFYDGSGNQGLLWDASAGNLAFSSGKGIDFSATSGTGTSELFSDYEEGTFTVAAARIASLVSNTAKYTKIGRLVTCEINISWTATDNAGGDLIFTGLPFTSDTGNLKSIGAVQVYGTDIDTDVGRAIVLAVDDNQTRFFLSRAIHSSLDYIKSTQMNSATTLIATFSYTTS